MEFGVDTLYRYEDGNKIPHTMFYPGDFKFPSDPSMAEVPEIDGKIWVSDVMESERNLFIKIWWDIGDSMRGWRYNIPEIFQ